MTSKKPEITVKKKLNKIDKDLELILKVDIFNNFLPYIIDIKKQIKKAIAFLKAAEHIKSNLKNLDEYNEKAVTQAAANVLLKPLKFIEEYDEKVQEELKSKV